MHLQWFSLVILVYSLHVLLGEDFQLLILYHDLGDLCKILLKNIYQSTLIRTTDAPVGVKTQVLISSILVSRPRDLVLSIVGPNKLPSNLKY